MLQLTNIMMLFVLVLPILGCFRNKKTAKSSTASFSYFTNPASTEQESTEQKTIPTRREELSKEKITPSSSKPSSVVSTPSKVTTEAEDSRKQVRSVLQPSRMSPVHHHETPVQTSNATPETSAAITASISYIGLGYGTRYTVPTLAATPGEVPKQSIEILDHHQQTTASIEPKSVLRTQTTQETVEKSATTPEATARGKSREYAEHTDDTITDAPTIQKKNVPSYSEKSSMAKKRGVAPQPSKSTNEKRLSKEFLEKPTQTA